MKNQLFVLFTVLLLFSYVAAELLSPSEVPSISESPLVSPSDAPAVLESPLISPSDAYVLSESPIVSPSNTPLLSPSSEDSEPSSNNDCSTVIYSMFDCLSFLTIGSTDLSPTKSCCDGVKIVLEYNPNCLCIALESSRDMGFELINRKALAMPSICNIPINSHCDVVSSPTASISTPETTTISPSEQPTNLSPPVVVTQSPPKVITSSPPAVSNPSPPTFTTPTPPTFTTPSPSVNPLLPAVISSPVRTASPPTITQSSPAMTALSPAIIAPSPSKSGATNLSISKLFLRIVTISTLK
ncbi:proline-rich protein 36-like [Raphanus sativus]|nr:proline-rich protein 36-like [Raphanus sativus]